LPSDFTWTSPQPLITPKSPGGRNFVSIQDPTIVEYDGAYHVFATVFDNASSGKGWSSVYLTFSAWDEANSARSST
jgi:endo-1,4-beta-xylanase